MIGGQDNRDVELLGGAALWQDARTDIARILKPKTTPDSRQLVRLLQTIPGKPRVKGCRPGRSGGQRRFTHAEGVIVQSGFFFPDIETGLTGMRENKHQILS